MAKFKLRNERRYNGSGAGFLVCLLIVVALLVLPGMALLRLKLDYRWVTGYAVLLNLITYWAYARDKRCAEEGEWRTPESRLHLMELLGGWPAALFAQRRLRHKCSKVSYQVMFWLIVLLWQLAAWDSMQGWKYFRMLAAKI